MAETWPWVGGGQTNHVTSKKFRFLQPKFLMTFFVINIFEMYSLTVVTPSKAGEYNSGNTVDILMVESIS